MTNEQIQWASQHHWFVKSIGDCVVVSDKLILNGNTVASKLLFRNYFELCKWVEASWLTNIPK